MAIRATKALLCRRLIPLSILGGTAAAPAEHRALDRDQPDEQGMQPASWLRVGIILGLIVFVLLLRICLWLAFHWIW
jgi:hypothetical protein